MWIESEWVLVSHSKPGRRATMSFSAEGVSKGSGEGNLFVLYIPSGEPLCIRTMEDNLQLLRSIVCFGSGNGRRLFAHCFLSIDS